VTVASQQGGGALSRPNASSLADVVGVILDKGLVVDAYVRVSLVGIELLTVDARVVIASVDTYLRFAEAANRLDIARSGTESKGLPDLMNQMQEGGGRRKTRGALEGVKDTVSDLLQGGEEDEYEEDAAEEEEEAPRRRKKSRERD
jgi:hypothetical protein